LAAVALVFDDILVYPLIESGSCLISFSLGIVCRSAPFFLANEAPSLLWLVPVRLAALGPLVALAVLVVLAVLTALAVLAALAAVSAVSKEGRGAWGCNSLFVGSD